MTQPLFHLARLSVLLMAAFTLVLDTGHATAQPTRPELVEGMSTVYKRVLTRPGATLLDAPEGRVLDRLPPFQPFYQFARRDGWTQVGPSISAAPSGWIADARLVDWKQNIVGAFTNSSGRSRQLLFDTEDDLRWLMNHEALVAVQERLLAEADTGIIDGNRGVISVEPQEFVNIRDELYLMPILDFIEDFHPATYEDLLMMQVASIPKDLPRQEQQDEFDMAIVFVFDTTQSMEPYIAQTARILSGFIQQINDSEIGKLANFGAIGFRDNTDAVPDLEYRTKMLAPLERRSNQSPVLQAIGQATQVARVSSTGFNEDSAAGVEDALDLIDWDQEASGEGPFDGRYIVLVTDAGPKSTRDPNARSEIGMDELQKEAEDRGIAVMTLHLKTPQGQATHDYAAGQYRTLSRFQGQQFYYPIENGDESAFEGTATRLVRNLLDHARRVRGEGRLQSDDDRDDALAELGRAMELAYLGRQQGTQVPDVLTGWITDRALETPNRLAVEPRLLLTKNEMATMATLLDRMIALAEQSQSLGESFAFFDQVRAMVAELATNPDMLVNPQADTLGGALEYLDNLPYQSQLLQMTPERWAEGATVRRAIIDGMRQKLTQYRKWLLDPAVWTALHDGAPDGEYVFAMPFDVLP